MDSLIIRDIVKKVLFLIAIASAASNIYAQANLIYAGSDGGFEMSATFSGNYWSVANGLNTTRVWQTGTGQPGYTGGNSAFIGDNSTTVGNTTQSRIVHLYKAVTMPATTGYLLLGFKYKQSVLQAGQDGLNVYLSTQIPQAGVMPTEALGTTTKIVGNYPSSAQPDFTQYSTKFDVTPLSLPQTVYIIFTFYADNTAPNAYGAIDDIELKWQGIITTAFTPYDSLQYQGRKSLDVMALSVNNNDGALEVVNSITYTTGATTSTDDIDSAKVFFSFYGYLSDSDVQFGPTVVKPSGTFTVSGQAWAGINNYFHLVYYVKPDAQIGNVLDASCTGITTTAPGTYKVYNENPAGTIPVILRLTGTVTVGTGGNYASLTKPGGLFYNINNKGLSGNLTVNIISDLTETGEIALNQWDEGGTPGNYTVTIKPDASLTGSSTIANLTGSISSSLIHINAADRVIFDGSNSGNGNYLLIKNTNTNSAASSLSLTSSNSNPAENITIKNCIIAGPSSDGGSGINVEGGKNVSIANNIFRSLETAISASYDTALSITGNEIGSNTQADYVRFNAITAYRIDSLLIQSNNIHNIIKPGFSTIGIWLNYGITHCIIDKNTMRYLGSPANGSTGIGLWPESYSSSNNIRLTNNIITDMARGISVAGTVTGLELYYNTVYLSGTYSSATDSLIFAALYIDQGCTGLKSKNNIFYNSIYNNKNSNSRSYAIYAKSQVGLFSESDYNDYYVSGSQGIVTYYGGDIYSFYDWQTTTGVDAHSFQYDPQLSYYNMKPFTTSMMLNSGTPVTGVTTDYAGNTRSGNTTLGAYEDSQVQNSVDWCNFNSPANAQITSTSVYTATARVYKPGVTDALGQGAGVEAWIGWSTLNTNPSNWDNWSPATYSGDVSSQLYDEYRVDLNSVIPNGTYYTASRFRIQNGAFQYGGINAASSDGGNIWNGTTAVSGRLNVSDATYISIPYTAPIANETFPAFWSQSSDIQGSPAPWSVGYFNNFLLQSVSNSIGTVRLNVGKINTTGYSSLGLRFNTGVSLGYPYRPVTFKVQSSRDGINWTDEAYTYSSGNLSTTTVTTTINNNLGGDTYLSFVATGEFYNFYYWALSDIELRAVPSASASLVIPYNNYFNQNSFPGTGMKFQVTSTSNQSSFDLTAERIPSSPGGVAPIGIASISQVYWTLKSAAWRTCVYSLTLDITGIQNTGKYSTLHLLNRANTSSLWVDCGPVSSVTKQQLVWTGLTVTGGEYAIGITTGGISPVITLNPSAVSRSVCLNDALTALTVSATGSVLTYQWFYNKLNLNVDGTAVSGAVSSSYTPPTSSAIKNYYYVVVSDSNGSSSVSTTSGLIIVNAPTIITVHPNANAQYYCSGSAVTALSITGTGTDSTYQWYVNANNSNTGGTIISGATSSTYSPPTTTGGIYYFYCVMSGGCDSKTSNQSGPVNIYAPVKPSGAGTSGDPYLIANYYNLLWISNDRLNFGYYYKQTANIDAINTACTFKSIGNDAYPFTGTYDGQNYSISNLSAASMQTKAGLFGKTSNATLMNLNLINETVTVTVYSNISQYGGGIAGYVSGGTISGCSVSCTITATQFAGGIAGYVLNGTVTECSASVKITATDYSGGLIGYASGSTVTGCSATGTINAAGSTEGGLIGYLYRSNLSNSYANDTLTVAGSYAGGLVGIIEQLSSDAVGAYKIQSCYSDGLVTAYNMTGGLVGYSMYGSIYNSYSKANVQRTSNSVNIGLGAFLGGDNTASYTIANCYSTGNVIYLSASKPTANGFSASTRVGVTYTNNFFDSTLSNQVTANGATAKTTALMQTMSTFTGWDFQNETANGTNDYWGINTSDNGAYPFLSWQGYYSTANNLVTVSGTAYTTLVSAFTAINNGAATGDISVTINESLTETASSTLYASGGVYSVTVSNGGASYTTAPLVTFSAPPAGGVTATGTATITSNKVTGITITKRGSGYITPPNISFSGGGGSNAAASPQIATYSSIKVYPRASGKTVSCNLAAPLVLLDGASKVTIDGRVNCLGSTADLILTNTYSTASTAAATIRFINGASNDTIRYCNVKGSNRDPGTGIIHFSTTATTSGNNYNVVDRNNITNGGTKPYKALYSLGTASYLNTGNVISNNNIYDYSNVDGNSSAVYIFTYSSGFQVTGNSIYETVSRTNTATGAAAFIYANCDGPITISGNYIGGSDVQCGGVSPMTKTGSSNIFYGIHLAAVSASTPSTVSGNVIDNISWTNTANADWQSIYMQSGQATISGNRIGDTTGTSSIQLTNTTTGGTFYGINAADTATVQNNQIGAIDLLSSAATIAVNFCGITCGAASTISGNKIGSIGTANSIKLNSGSTSNAQTAYGIKVTSAGVNSVSNNIISNIVNGTTNTTAATAGLIQGINVTAGTTGVIGNTIRDLTIANANTGTDAAVCVGGIIFSVSTALAQNISTNSIFNLSNTYASYAGNIIGLFYSGSTTASTVSRNNIYGITVPGASSAAATIYGIKIAAGVTKYFNNMIALGGNTKTTLYGIYETGAASNNNSLYFNSISLSGSLVSGATNKSYALYSNASTNVRDIRDNILYNTRSTVSGISLHFAMYFNYTVSTNLTLDYNDYYASVAGVGGALGWYNAKAVTAIPLITSFDANSKNISISFTSSTDLHLSTGSINNYSLKVLPITGITTDFDGETRNASWPYMGADENLVSPLPVELTAFSARTSGRQVYLNWNTATEVRNYGFNIERMKEKGEWEVISFISGKGNSNSPTDYAFIDKKPSCGNLSYRLEQLDVDGGKSYSKTVSVKVDFPTRFDLLQNYPNPFNAFTIISYDVPELSRVKLTVYDALGREIVKLFDEEKEPGIYSMPFAGGDFSSGVYYYRLEGKGFAKTCKMLMIK